MKRKTGEALALAVLVLGLWTVPAMVSQGQDRTPETLAALHVDSALIGNDAAANDALREADALALSFAR
jgi:hypothetical protein